MNLRKAARGRPCQIRIPGVCNHNAETSVLAHYRHHGFGGVAIKPPDLLAAIACSDCHDAVDRRRHTHLDYDFVRACHAEGVLRTINLWVREGFVRW